MNFKAYKEKLLKDPSFKREYEKSDLAFEISKMIINVRIAKGITQEKLASLMKTKQPSIARVEGGNYLPSLRFLEKMANVLGLRLEAPKFILAKEYECEWVNHNTNIIIPFEDKIDLRNDIENVNTQRFDYVSDASHLQFVFNHL